MILVRAADTATHRVNVSGDVWEVLHALVCRNGDISSLDCVCTGDIYNVVGDILTTFYTQIRCFGGPCGDHFRKNQER